eukprot:14165-Heterococcus_DN1.PRE.3
MTDVPVCVQYALFKYSTEAARIKISSSKLSSLRYVDELDEETNKTHHQETYCCGFCYYHEFCEAEQHQIECNQMS